VTRQRADRRPRAALALFLVTALLVLSAACSDEPPRASVYGDSLLVPSQEAVKSQVADAARLTLKAYPGADLPVWDNEIRETRPSRLVLALGTNDARLKATAPWSDLFSFLSPTTCIVWPRAYPATDQIAAFDTAMDQLIATHPNVRVVDWASQVAAHPEYLIEDGVHYNATGEAAYTEMLVKAVEECV